MEYSNGYFYVSNGEAIVSLEDITKVASLVSCGPMEIRTINLIERQDLTNGCCVYWLASPNKVGNPFNIACVRRLDGSKIFEGEDHKISSFITDNLDCIMDPDSYDESKVVINGEEREISGYLTVDLEEDDYRFIIENCIMEKASLFVDRINSLYFLHGYEDYKDYLYDSKNERPWMH